MASIRFVTAVRDESELDLLNVIGNEYTERRGYHCGVWKTEQSCGLAFCCGPVAGDDVDWASAGPFQDPR